LSHKAASILDPKTYRDPRLKESLLQLREWMGPRRGERPEGYLNLDKYFYAYIAYYLPLHLPELYWILEQLAKKDFPLSTKNVLDVGCGPGTLTLSLLLWLEKQQQAKPEKIVLWDNSQKALALAKEKILKLNASDATKIFSEKVKLPNFAKNDERFDLIVVGHFLNEWGAGPRFRAKKISFLNSLVKAKLSAEGTLIVIEPPLKECTLDLMQLRNELARTLTIVAPCPQSDKLCPMLEQNLGWCYAQPPREAFRKAGIAPFDAQLEKLLKIQLTHPGFSYFAATKKTYRAPACNVFVSEQRKSGDLSCEVSGKIVETKSRSLHRGEIRSAFDKV